MHKQVLGITSMRKVQDFIFKRWLNMSQTRDSKKHLLHMTAKATTLFVTLSMSGAVSGQTSALNKNACDPASHREGHQGEEEEL